MTPLASAQANLQCFLLVRGYGSREHFSHDVCDLTFGNDRSRLRPSSVPGHSGSTAHSCSRPDPLAWFLSDGCGQAFLCLPLLTMLVLSSIKGLSPQSFISPGPVNTGIVKFGEVC